MITDDIINDLNSKSTFEKFIFYFSEYKPYEIDNFIKYYLMINFNDLYKQIMNYSYNHTTSEFFLYLELIKEIQIKKEKRLDKIKNIKNKKQQEI